MKKSFLFYFCVIFFLLIFNAKSEQVYRNNDFQFRIVYPDNWTSVLPKGENIKILISSPVKTTSCSVLSIENPESVKAVNQEELDTMWAELGVDKTFWFDALTEKFADPEILDYGRTYLDNRPAIYVKANLSYSALGITIRGTLYQVLLMRRNFRYALTCMSPVEDYADYELDLIKIISSFVLEDY